MFRQLVTPGPPAPPGPPALDNINSLFLYHPLQLSAIIETYWLNRVNAAAQGTGAPFLPWSPQTAVGILKMPFFPGYDWSGVTPVPLPPGTGAPPPGFTPPLQQPGIANTWDGVGPFPPAGFLSTNWDHLMYAYLVENTRIYEIFARYWKPTCSPKSWKRPARRARASGGMWST